MGMLSRISNLFGRGSDDALSVPPMDGVFKPNTRLDTARRVLDLPAIDNLAAGADGALHCSSGNRLYRIDPRAGTAELVREFDGPITMLAARPSGGLAVAVEGTGLSIMDDAGGLRAVDLPKDHAACLTAGLFESDDVLLLAVGSCLHAMSEWKRDLMSHGESGLVLRHSLSTGRTEVLADGLAFPYGLARLPDGDVAVSESWRHRIVAIRPGGGRPSPLLSDLPAYPARLAPAADGGHWLALFAPRRQLTELVLRESDYRMEMMATIAPDAWIGPGFSDGGDSTEQFLQSGSVRQMGIMKPWAPSRSYGMVVRLDASLQPVASFHSRADGAIHGIASVAETGRTLHAASRGAGALVALDTGSGAAS